MVKDKFVVGTLIGICANVIKLLTNLLGYLMGYTDHLFWQLVATHFLQENDLSKPAALVIGGVADLTITAALGVAFLYFVEYTGRKYLWFKGLGFGLAVWVILFGTHLGRSVQELLPQDAMGIVVTLIAHMVFGLSLAFFTRVYDRYALRHGLKRHI